MTRGWPLHFLAAHSLPVLAIAAVAVLAVAAALLWLLPVDPALAQDDAKGPKITAGPVITSSPENDETYRAGEAITVTLTFGQPVTVTGKPRLGVMIGENRRWARYNESGGATLSFAYAVKPADADDDGIRIRKNALRLNGGSIEDADGNAARLKHPALPKQAGHKVNGAPDEPEPPANNEPQFTDETAARSVNENAAAGENVGAAVTAEDDDGDALTYALAGADAGAFDLDAASGQITVKDALDFENKASYTLTVSVHDGKDTAGEADASEDDNIEVTVSVLNVDEPGVVVLDTDAPQAGSALTASLSDPDGGVTGETWAWERSAAGGEWTVIAGATSAAYTPTRDDGDHYLRATASYADGQGTGKSATAATAGTVAPEPPSNNEPYFIADTTSRSVNENVAAGEDVGAAVAASDADGDALTYALSGADAGAFNLDAASGQISVRDALDYEGKSGYTVTVTVHDGENAYGEDDTGVDDAIAVTVSVLNVDEAGAVSLDTDAPQAGSALTAGVSDPDGGVSGVTWAWERSADGSDWTAIAGATSAAYTPTDADAGQYLRATASYADGQGAGKSARQTTSGRVTAAPEPTPQPAASNHEPQFPGATASRSVNENAPAGENVGAAVAASDGDGDALTYALAGADAGAFSLAAATGQISVKDALDYEAKSSYSVSVSVHDGRNAAGEVDTSTDDTIAVTITVSNVDEAGVVSLVTPHNAFRVGDEISAVLLDPDGGVSGLAWAWERSAGGSDWTAIAGATSAAHTPTGDAAGQYLRATAAYADGQGAGKTARAAAGPVAAPPAQQQQAATAPAIIAGPNLNNPVVADVFSNIYGLGEEIVVSFTFSEAVTVTGAPRVALAIGAYTGWAGYSGSGDDGATLSFTHTVVPDDWDTDGLSIAANALELNGGAINGAGGAAADLSHPAVAPGNTHQVDGVITVKQPVNPPAADPTVPPQIQSATPAVSFGPILNSPARGNAYLAGEDVLVSLTFSEPVTVAGAPRVALGIGDATRWAAYRGTAGDGATLNFAYTVAPEDRDDDGLSVGANALELNGGAITGAGGNPASLQHPETAPGATHRVDGSALPGQAQSTTPPAAPANLTATAGPAQVALSWDDPSDSGITGYQYQRKPGTGEYSDWLDMAGSGAATTSYTVTELTGNTTYTFKIRAVKGTVTGPASGEANDTTSAPSASTTVWTATLTVDRWIASVAGCSDSPNFNEVDNCSDSSALSDNDFSYAGTSYTITGLLQSGNAVRRVLLYLDQAASPEVRNNLMLHVDTEELALAAYWESGDGTVAEVDCACPHWSHGQQVALKLTTVLPPAAPANLTATAGDGQVALIWDASGDSSISKYQYRQKAGSVAYGQWTDMTGSGAKSNTHSVTGLTNGTAYAFEIRAVNAQGSSPASGEAGATPAAAMAVGPRGVPADWPLVPASLGVGDSFRLLFITSTKRNAESPNVADYNAFVRNAANGNGDLRPYRDDFRALVSSATVDARDNTATTGTGVPIYWLGGAKLADDYADFYDGSWDSCLGVTETGADAPATATYIWTGSDDDGTEPVDSNANEKYHVASTAQGGRVAVGSMDRDPRFCTSRSPIYFQISLKENARPLYGVSPVFTVIASPPAAQTVEITSALVPASLDIGDQFRLLFVTFDRVPATSTDIDYYNNHVKGVAQGNELLGPFRDEFRALVSTETVSARDNTATGPADGRAYSDGEGVPIHWVPGDHEGAGNQPLWTNAPPKVVGSQAADGYADFYDDSWHQRYGTNQNGDNFGGSRRTVWTGSNADGTRHATAYAGAPTVRTGHSQGAGLYYNISSISHGQSDANPGTHYDLFALSPVLTIVDTARPAKPAGLQVVPSHEAAVLLWTDPSDRSVTGYQYRVGSGAWTDVPGSDAATVRHLVTGLTNERTYSFRLRAVDTVGAGAQSDAVRAKIGLTAPEGQTVEATSGLVPEGLQHGDRFRLLFVTSDPEYALPTGIIKDSNDRVQAAAARNSLLAPFRDHFRAIISTGAVDARDNTDTAPANGSAYASGEGAPIYWVKGEKAADNYADFYDGSWDSRAWKTEIGNQVVSGGTFGREVWTGSDSDGTKHSSNYAGASQVRYGWLGNNPMSDNQSGLRTTGNGFAYYGLSPVITVADTVRPVKPADVRVFPSDGGASLAWTRTDDKTVSKYQYRQKAGSGAYGDWTDLVDSGRDTVWYEVTGLTNGVEHTIELRAVDYAGPGAATEVTATPSALASQDGAAEPQSIASDSALAKAVGVHAGSFRLLFATSELTTAEAPDIRYYNRHVRDVAGNNPLLEPFKDEFRAVISTAEMDAEYNVEVSPDTGGPDIFWMNGKQVTYLRFQPAFYSGAWVNRQPLDESGAPYNGEIFTGTAERGLRHPTAHAGAENVVIADTEWSRLDGPTRPASEKRAVYALSPVIHVRERIEEIDITPGVEQLEVDWNNVPNATSYLVSWRSTAQPWQSQLIEPGQPTEYTITGLESGTAYDVKVSYYKGVLEYPTGTSHQVEEANNDGEITLSWSRERGLVYAHVKWRQPGGDWTKSGRIGPNGVIDPADDNPVGWNPNRYPSQWYTTSDGGMTRWEPSSYTITGLTPGETYWVHRTYEVPENQDTPLGEGQGTTTGTGTSMGTPPKLGKVQGLTAESQVGRIDVSWDQETDAESYVLQWRPKNEESWGADRQVTLEGKHNTRYQIHGDGLELGERYRIRVCAIREGATPATPKDCSPEAEGFWSDEAESHVAGVKVTATALGGLWVEMASPHEVTFGFEVQWEDSPPGEGLLRPSHRFRGTKTKETYEITGLKAETEYKVFVGFRWPHPSYYHPLAMVKATTEEAPPAPAAPTGLRGTPGDGKITLSWSHPNPELVKKFQYRGRPTDRNKLTTQNGRLVLVPDWDGIEFMDVPAPWPARTPGPPSGGAATSLEVTELEEVEIVPQGGIRHVNPIVNGTEYEFQLVAVNPSGRAMSVVKVMVPEPK